MYDIANGRDLPLMEDWSPSLVEEAIACEVRFSVLVLGQGRVVGRMVKALLKSRIAVITVTYDPRGWLTGRQHTTDMRRVCNIPYPEYQFSLTRQDTPDRRIAASRKIARKVIADTKARVEGNPKPFSRPTFGAGFHQAVGAAAVAAKAARSGPLASEAAGSGAPATRGETKVAARARTKDPRLSPLQRRILLAREN